MTRSDVRTRDDAVDVSTRPAVAAARWRNWLAAALGLHGLVHATGLVLLWDLATPANLTYAEATPDPGSAAGRLVGTGWLVAGGLFVAAAVLLHRRSERFWPTLIAATLLSMAVLLPSQDGASLGILVDLLVILVALKVVARDRRTPAAPASR